jgi:1-acyl-sn-glycerol-3-phosphate acyltransferase
MLAIKGKVPVIPVAITSSYIFFKRTSIKVGKPIDLSEYYDKRLSSEDYTKISIGIMSRINGLKKDESNESNST